MSITHQVFVVPSAIAVGLPDPQAVLCIEVFERAGLKVHRADPAAACERMTKLLPQIVVIPSDQDFASIEKTLDEAVNTARALRGKKPRSA